PRRRAGAPEIGGPMERFRHVPSLLAFSADKMKKVGLVDTPNFFCDAYCLEPGQEQAGHRHAVGDKLYYVLSGAGRIRVGAEERIFSGTLGMRFTLTGVQAEVCGDLAWVVLTENIDSRHHDGKVEAHVQATNLFERRDRRWFLVHHQGSPIFGPVAAAEQMH